ncbi:MAG: hypothetical protein HQ485_09925 [Acidobacteria bacterium]|nr:hypothetical protein [Acidobacteriota bacterium]
MTIQGRRQSLWRAVDQDGDVIDILVQPRRNRDEVDPTPWTLSVERLSRARLHEYG